LYISEQKPIVTDKYIKRLQLLKQTNEDLIIYPSTFMHLRQNLTAPLLV